MKRAHLSLDPPSMDRWYLESVTLFPHFAAGWCRLLSIFGQLISWGSTAKASQMVRHPPPAASGFQAWTNGESQVRSDIGSQVCNQISAAFFSSALPEIKLSIAFESADILIPVWFFIQNLYKEG